MAAPSYFVPGYTYSNYTLAGTSPNYGTRRDTVFTNTQVKGTREYDWFCTSASRLFAVFLDDTRTVQRRRIFRDAIGRLVFPFGRYPGAPVFRPEDGAIGDVDGPGIPDVDVNPLGQ
jgi:hypothetical protein